MLTSIYQSVLLITALIDFFLSLFQYLWFDFPLYTNTQDFPAKRSQTIKYTGLNLFE